MYCKNSYDCLELRIGFPKARLPVSYFITTSLTVCSSSRSAHLSIYVLVYFISLGLPFVPIVQKDIVSIWIVNEKIYKRIKSAYSKYWNNIKSRNPFPGGGNISFDKQSKLY